jgi:uncharacterized protein involved in oxidation of intracellular sulfur
VVVTPILLPGPHDLFQSILHDNWDIFGNDVPVKVCGTCKARCGIHKGEPYFDGTQEAKMTELARWIEEADKVVSF